MTYSYAICELGGKQDRTLDVEIDYNVVDGSRGDEITPPTAAYVELGSVRVLESHTGSKTRTRKQNDKGFKKLDQIAEDVIEDDMDKICDMILDHEISIHGKLF